MCTNFTDLNKCYPKDNSLLARIDQIVDIAMEARRWHYWTTFQGTIIFGFTRKTKKRLVSIPHSGLIVTSECPKVFAMQAQHYAE
jgi:hypothetical protein